MGKPHAHSLAGAGVLGDPASWVHHLDARVKIVGFLAVTIVAVSTPLSLWPVYAVCALGLAATAASARVGPAAVWRRARVVLPLVLLVAAFAPLHVEGNRVGLGPVGVSDQGLRVFAEAAATATLGTVSAVLLVATTSFPALLHGLERLRVPRTFVLVAAVTYRYLFVVADEARRMRNALAARAFRPRHLLHVAPLGAMAAALFLRSHSRGERVHLAMLARGYQGSFPVPEPRPLSTTDGAFLALALGLPLAARLGLGVWW